MIVFILFGVFIVMGLLAGLAMRRSKAIQDNPNFAPSDHVEVDRKGGAMGRRFVATETHHDDDPPEFEIGQ
jgi:hypothetical protein